MKSYKERIFKIIQIGNRTDIPSTVFDIFISVVILFAITVTFMQTFSQFDNSVWLDHAETLCIMIFVVEYCLRIFTAEFLFPNVSPLKAVLKYVFSFYGLIDFLTIFSYFNPFLFSTGIIALRMLRVLRIARLFQFSIGYDAFDIIFNVLREKRYQILSSVIIISLLMIMASLLMYSLEHDAQPEAFANGFSGLWWAVSTILTVGYGDIYPITILGRIMAIIIAFLGVGLVAMPTGIISAGFVEYYQRESLEKHRKDKAAGMSRQMFETYEEVPEPMVEAASGESYASVQMALLRKQTPKYLVDGCCPLCGTNLSSLQPMAPDYCPVCGQNISEKGCRE